MLIIAITVIIYSSFPLSLFLSFSSYYFTPYFSVLVVLCSLF